MEFPILDANAEGVYVMRHIMRACHWHALCAGQRTWIADTDGTNTTKQPGGLTTCTSSPSCERKRLHFNALECEANDWMNVCRLAESDRTTS